MTPLWTALIFVLLALFLWRWSRPKNFPPGPWAVPVFGNFLQVDFSNPLPEFKKLAKKYGNVFSIYMGNNLVVVLHGYHALKEALVNYGPLFADRPVDPMLDRLLENRGIVGARYGQSWKEQRRFSLTLLKNFGLGKTSMEKQIFEEAKHMVKYFKENEDPVTLANQMKNAGGSSTVNEALNIVTLTEAAFCWQSENFVIPNYPFLLQIYNAIPLIRGLPLPFQKAFKNMDIVKGFLHDIIGEHKRTFTPGEPRDFIDNYLEEIAKRQNDGSSFTDENLHSLMFDLLEAGSNTQASATLWSLLVLMTYPDIQEKCYSEIHSVFDGKEEISYTDRADMPYTTAFIHEVQRFAAIAPFGVSHCFTKEVSFLGYTISPNTRVMIDLSSALWDESQWKFPNEFNPANFLNNNGEFVKPDAFFAFSAGPRMCLGENLAHMETFIIISTLLKHFEFFWPDKSTVPDLKRVFAIVHFPIPYKVGYKSR
ncbi:cytochrome P450 2J2-like [Protopterus annectens]|uniref:cytochrome P450 2J2-like n=1 Tax=Protopterus annectens TaxID=7888 RepID=UPI001CF9B84A|nr:cytochrome P450 2J2-like [Protopterus annectens]